MISTSVRSAQTTNIFVGLQQVNLDTADNKLFCRIAGMDKPDLSTFSGRLEYAMQTAKLSQAELARRINVKQQNIAYLIKKGQGSSHTNQIANELHVNADWLATGKGEPTALVAPPITEESSESLNRLSFGFSEIKGILRMSENDSLLVSITSIDLPTHKVAILNWSATTLCYQIKGNELQPALYDGWIVAVDPALTPQSGELVIVNLKDGSSIFGMYLYDRVDSVTVQSVKNQRSSAIDRSNISEILPFRGIAMPSQATTI